MKIKLCFLFALLACTTYAKNLINSSSSLLEDEGVQVKVELREDGKYAVLLKSTTTLQGPVNFVSNAQITITVPTGGFRIGELESLMGRWTIGSVTISPIEAKETDYISFGLSGGKDDFVFEEGREVTLFTFMNTGICTGEVELMIEDDPFSPPNSKNINIGNIFSIFGFGFGNKFLESYEIGSATCSLMEIETAPIVEIKTATSMVINWTANEEVFRYHIKGRVKGTSEWLASLSLAEPKFHVYLPKKEETYEYQIETFYNNGTTEFSDIFEITPALTE